jgi:hypothetical protein
MSVGYSRLKPKFESNDRFLAELNDMKFDENLFSTYLILSYVQADGQVNLTGALQDCECE